MGSRMPEPIVSAEDESNPEHEALVADSVGFALLIVLEALSPPERLAFVLHDMFGVPFDEIGSIVGRSPDAARQLASRARRRVRGAPEPDVGVERQREVVDAFLEAARGGDMEALMKVLDPDVVVRVDRGALPARELHGADTVAKEALTGAGAQLARFARPALVNGAAGFVLVPRGRPTVVVACTVAGGHIVEVDVLADPGRVRELDLTFLDD